MNYGEEVQVAAMAQWGIDIGRLRHVTVGDASPGLVKATAQALSAANPDEEVRVMAGLRIRYWFRAGVEVNITPDDVVKERCPFSSSQYRRCWELGETFPIEAWVDVGQDGKKSIL